MKLASGDIRSSRRQRSRYERTTRRTARRKPRERLVSPLAAYPGAIRTVPTSSGVEVIATCIVTAMTMRSPAPPAGSSPMPPASAEFFKEDHLTGADYLALYASGEYELIGREHMGIFPLERGTWTRDGDRLSFKPKSGLRPEASPRPPYHGLRVTSKSEVFLVWSGEEAAGIAIPEEEVKADLAKGEGYPPYVFFRIAEKAFRCETGVTYPFRFHPEMNQGSPPPGCEEPSPPDNNRMKLTSGEGRTMGQPRNRAALRAAY